MIPVGYSRVSLTWRNEMPRPLTEDDARDLLGSEILIALGETVRSTSVITNVRVLDDGARMEATAEVGGRLCAACGHVYPLASVHLMGQLNDLRERMPTIYDSPIYDALTPWTMVCREAATCLFRRMEQ